MAEISEGDKAPDFDLATDSGGRTRLKDFRGKKVVVYFYPADDTSGCTLEAIDFTKAVEQRDPALAMKEATMQTMVMIRRSRVMASIVRLLREQAIRKL